MSSAPTKPVEAGSPVKRALLAIEKLQSRIDQVEAARREPIAIVGASCRLPGGVQDLSSYWDLLVNGRDAVTEVPPERWDVDAFYSPDPLARGKMNSRSGGFLSDIDGFDANFFGISAREAISLDPQQRQLLEVAWEALEDAGQPADRVRGSATGVFVGMYADEYLDVLNGSPSGGDAYAATGGVLSFAAGRLSYLLDLRGPSLVVNTVCSSSLVAIDLACQSLRNGRCERAVVGATSLMLTPSPTVYASKLFALAPDGRCKTFDALADGYVRGEGCAVVVLKRLSDARAANDRILATIRGSAVNQDGQSTSLTAPNVLAQEALIRSALADAGVVPADVSYVEAHGTGTALGDPIELDALKAVLGAPRPDGGRCVVGSVKPNLGHLEAVAGMAGLLKVVACFAGEKLVGQLHFHNLNPHIKLDGTCLEISRQGRAWPRGERPRIAGVSSFGLSGTNAHVVLQEAPVPEPRPDVAGPRVQIVPVSARGEPSLRAQSQRMADAVERQGGDARWLEDASYTASARRTHHPDRLCAVGESAAELARALRSQGTGQADPALVAGHWPGGRRRVVFVYSGQGSQWIGMGRRLLEECDAFAARLRACDEALREPAGFSVLEVLASDAEESGWKRVEVIQPLLWALQVALTAQWSAWGVEPDAVIGHSLGEVAASVVSGALSLEDGARVIGTRSRLVSKSRGQGGMALAELGALAAQAEIAGYPSLSIASYHGPETVLLSGEQRELAELVSRLEARGIFSRLVDVDYASHSAQMDGLLGELRQRLRDVQPRPAQRLQCSTLLGELIGGTELDADYWARNLREPVRFHQSVERLMSLGYEVFVEISPHPVLTPTLQRIVGGGGEALGSLRRDADEVRELSLALARLHVSGVEVDWERRHAPFAARPVALPAYSWAHQRYWAEPADVGSGGRQGDLPTDHGWLGSGYACGVQPDLSVWQGTPGRERTAWLAEHRVNGRAIAPGALWIEAALRIARQTWGAGAHRICGLQFSQPLSIDTAEPPLVQIAVTREGEGEAAFQLLSSDAAAPDRWNRHGHGRIARAGQAGGEAPADEALLERVRQRCGASEARAQFYQRLEAAGLGCGPSFQAVESIRCGDREALADLVLPADRAAEAGRFAVHPALLDACFQTMAGALPAAERAMYVAVGIDDLCLLRAPGSRGHAHARLLGTSAGVLSGEVTLYDERGRAVLEARGLRFARLEAGAAGGHPLDEWLYGVRWEARGPVRGGDRRLDGDRYLVFSDGGPTSAAVLAALRERGASPVVVEPGPSFERRGAGHYLVDPERPEHYRALLAEAFPAGGPPCRAVLHLWSAGGPEAAAAELRGCEIEAAQRLGCGSVLHLVQALAERGAAGAPRLWLATRDSQPVGQRPMDVTHAPLWGFARAIALEHPELHCSCFDLDGDDDRSRAALVREVAGDGPEDQVAARGADRFVARIGSRHLDDLLRGGSSEPVAIRGDASYLITGGCGAIGLALARWLVDRGARHVTLLGRSEPSSEARLVLEELAQRGAELTIERGSVSSEDDVARLVQRLGAAAAPLRGVVHAAAVAKDGLAVQRDWSDFQAVLAPKVRGAWALHQATRGLPLDFFVMFSSAASILGLPGGANYSAGNAFLDALAHRRAQEGLPALSIDWGAWTIGLAARKTDRGDRFVSIGLRGISTEQSLDAFGTLLAARVPQVALMALDSATWQAALAGAARIPYLSELAAAAAAPVPAGGGVLPAGGSPAERRAFVASFVRRQVAKTFRVTEGQLTDGTRLSELGCDSLTALELKNHFAGALGVTITPLRLLKGPSLGELIDEIAGQVGGGAAGRPADVQAPPPIVPDPAHRFDPFPLTDIQQAYWVGRNASMQLGSTGCHVYLESEQVGLDPARLERAWQRVVERHDMLRAVVMPDGRQRVLEHVEPYRMVVRDLRGLDPAAVEAALSGERERMADQLFAPDTWPLFDISLSLLDGDRLRLHFSLDLLTVDPTTVITTLGHWGAHYADPELPAVPSELSFRDYVLAVMARRQGDDYRRSQEYWARRLRSLPGAPELPLAKDPGTVLRPRFATRSAFLEQPLWERIKQRAQREGVTASAVVLSAFAEVLDSWSASPRFTINLTLFSRLPLHPQVHEVVGDFTSTMLLEVRETPGTFLDRVRALHAQLLEDLDHIEVSGVQVMRELARARGELSLMSVVFTSMLGHRDIGTVNWLGRQVARATQTPQLILDAQVLEQDGGLVYSWDSVEEVFPEGTVDAMYAAYGAILRRLATDEGAWGRPCEIPLPPEQRERRAAYNATDLPVSGALLHTLFQAQAAAHGERPAVISAARRLTYGELDARATAIGRWLRASDVRPNQLVAIVMDKGWEQIAAALGVLNSGAAYLPIDANLPADRIAYLLRDAAVRQVLTQSARQARIAWPEGVAVRAVDVDADWPDAADQRPLVLAQSPDDLAYVIYTSGSTGKPKGVAISHRGAVNTVLDVNARFGVTAEDRVLALSSMGFDLSVYDLFGLLAAGGAIVLPEADAARDPAAWLALVRRERVTIWNSVPALMQLMADHLAGTDGAKPALRLVMLSGDWIPVDLPDRVRALCDGPPRVVSLGGATEASIWSIHHPVGDVDPAWPSIPYGAPLANQRCYVLDGRLRPRPEEVPGEIFIAGIGLGREYLGDEARTRASFIVHPETGERLYRTGDLGRFRRAGYIEFLGRNDFQVKVQGHRIELGEIEAALKTNPDVADAVVAVHGDVNSGKYLAAYVVPRPGAASGLDDAQPPALQLLTTDAERLAFKLGQHNLRRHGRDATRVALPPAGADEGRRRALYAERRSHRRFAPAPLGLPRLSALLDCLRPMAAENEPLGKFRYPSAGHLYPVQTYLYVAPGRVDGLPGGTYHYDFETHELVALTPDARIDSSVQAPVNRAFVDQSAFALFLVAQMAAIEPMYGPLARDFCLIEVGAMSQLLMTAAHPLELGLCQVGAMRFESIAPLFKLGEGHLFLHALFGGGAVENAAVAAAPPPAETRSLESNLRAALARTLPSYMIPSAFVTLDRLPLTENGKVDRKALRPPVSAPRAHVPPSTDAEKRLGAIMCELLGVDTVSTQTNLFEVGFTSLQLVKLAHRLQQEFGQPVPVVELFRLPTLAALAGYLNGLAREGEPAATAAAAAESDDRAAKRRAMMAARDRRRTAGEGE